MQIHLISESAKRETRSFLLEIRTKPHVPPKAKLNEEQHHKPKNSDVISA